MKKEQLRTLGRQLKESRDTTDTFDAMVDDLRAKLKVFKQTVLTTEKVGDDSYTYKFEKPKKDLTEAEAIVVKPATDIWKDAADSSKTYIANAVYGVRKIEGGAKYEVTTEVGTERKPFTTLDRAGLDAAFTPVHPKQTPDAEGYTQYRKTDEIEAIKYAEDTLKVDLGDGTNVLLSKGDYLLRKASSDVFTYEVKKAKDFEVNYSPK